jgi:tagatose 1,6-diphosphate aldolase
MASPGFPGLSSDMGLQRALQTCQTPSGLFTVLAIDHPATFILGVPSPQPPSPTQVSAATAAKQDVIEALGPHCSAVLVDPAMGLPAAVPTGALPGSTGLMLCLDAEPYQVGNAISQVELRPNWGPDQIKCAGGAAAKLLWRYRDDVPAAPALRAQARNLAAQCRAVSLPFVVEPVWVPLPGEDLSAPDVRARRVRGVIVGARRAQELGADIVKTEFPGWVGTASDREAGAAACDELDASLDVPWLLLSAGVGFDGFLTQCAIAAQAGASGYIAGRAVWDRAASADPTVRARGLAVAARRLQRLTAVFEAFGKPVTYTNH